MVAKVLLEERPRRPNDPSLTDELWALTKLCLAGNPQRRPKITDIVHYLQRALAAKQDRTHTPGDTTDVTLGGIRPPAITPGGLKSTRFAIFSRPRRHSGLENTSHESGYTSNNACSIRSKGSWHSLECVGSAPGPRNLLRRAAFWLLSCGMPSAHGDQDDIPVLLSE